MLLVDVNWLNKVNLKAAFCYTRYNFKKRYSTLPENIRFYTILAPLSFFVVSEHCLIDLDFPSAK